MLFHAIDKFGIHNFTAKNPFDLFFYSTNDYMTLICTICTISSWHFTAAATNTSNVLDAYQELLNSNVEEVKARRNYYVSGMNVLMAMGKLTAEDLKLNVDIYNPKKYYKETRDKWLSLSVEK